MDLRVAKDISKSQRSFSKKLFSFRAFLRQIIQQGRIARQFLNTGLTVAIRVEGRLEATDRQWAFGRLPPPTSALLPQLVNENDFIDQAHLEGFLSVVLPA